MKQVLKNFFTYGIGNALQSVLTFILLPLYLKYFPPSEYGVIASLTVVVALLTLIFSSGVMNGLMRLYYEYDTSKRKDLAGNTMAWYILVAVLGAVLLYFLSGSISDLLFRVDKYAGVIKLLAVTLLFSIPLSVPKSVLRLETRSLHFVFLSLFIFLFDFVLKIYFILVLDRGLRGYFESGLIANAATMLVAMLMTKKYMRLSVDINIIRQVLRLGSPFIVSGLAMWTLDVSDRLLLARLSGQEAVGIYSLANSFANIFSIILATPIALLIDPFFFSRAAGRTDEENKALLRRMLTYYFLVGGVVFLIIAIGTGELLHILTAWFGARESYLVAVKIVPIITLAPFLYFLASQAGYVGLLIKKPEIISAACVAAAVVNVVINLFAIPVLGAFGAALSTIVAYVVLLILVYWLTERLYPVSYDWSGLVKLSMYLIASFAVGSFVSSDVLVLSLLMKVLSAVALFTFLAFFVGGVISKAERSSILQFAFRKT